MDNKKINQKHLNARIWGGDKELNVEGADAVVFLAFTHGEDGTMIEGQIEGGFTGRDYMEAFEQIANAFGREHLMMYMLKDSAKELMRRIARGNDDEKDETEPDCAESCDGEKPDRD